MPAFIPRDCNAHLEKILASPQFADSPRLQQSLRFMVEEALQGRAPIAEAKVEVRLRLSEYYRSGGREDKIIFELPEDGGVPEFRLREPRFSSRKRSGRYGLLGAALAVLAISAGIASFIARHQQQARPLTTLAVLPFSRPETTPSTDRLAETVLTDLTAALVRSSALRITTADSQEAGVVVQGSLQKEGDRWRVVVNLVKTRDQYPMYSESFLGPETELGAFVERAAAGITLAVTGPRR